MNAQDLESSSVSQAQIEELAREHELEAKAEHLRLISNQVAFVVLGNVVASVIVLVGSWDVVPRSYLFVWCGLLIGFNTIRLVAARRFFPQELSQRETQRWERRLLGSTLFSGLMWGSVGFFFYVPGELGHNFFLTTVVVGMAAAAVTAHSYHKLAYPSFFIPAVMPLTVNLLLESDVPARAVGAVIPFYFFLMHVLSRRIYNSAHTAVLGRFVNYYFATHDYLTGVANRRAFQEALDKEWERALRTQQPLSLMIADADNFKFYNDQHGHAAGDQILVALAHMIRDRIRKGADLAARIGGEEFAVVLPETTSSDARRIAEDIKDRSRAIKLAIGGVSASPTLSAGVATMVPRPHLQPSVLFNAADRALYRAKSQGKDRVAVEQIEVSVTAGQ